MAKEHKLVQLDIRNSTEDKPYISYFYHKEFETAYEVTCDGTRCPISIQEKSNIPIGYKYGSTLPLYIKNKIKESDNNIALKFAEWIDINGIRDNKSVWLYKGDNFKDKYSTEQMYEHFIKETTNG